MRVAWLLRDSLEPAVTGASIRLRELMKAVIVGGHDVDVYQVREPNMPEGRLPSARTWQSWPARRRTAVSTVRGLLSPAPAWTWWSSPQELGRALLRERLSADLVVAEHPAMTGLAMAIAHAQPAVPVVLHAHNIESDLWRQIAAHSRGVTRWRWRVQAEKLRRLEREAFPRAAAVVVVSEADASRARHLGGESVQTVTVPNAFDVARIDWRDHGPVDAHSVVFVGHLGYPPNVDACRYLVDEILPLLRLEVPDITVDLVGRAPVDAVTALADPHKGIRVHADVPDVRPFLAAAGVFAIPMRVGGGTSLKVIEALASGVPIVSTVLGVRGFGVADAGLAVVSDEAHRFAEAVAHLLRSPEDRSRLSREGRAYVEARFDWRHSGATFAARLERVASG